MPKLTILRGISGSRKSTWAESQNAVVVSRDRIRMATFRTETPIDEELITKIEHAMIDAALKAGHNVISDNTNLTLKFANAIARIGYKNGADVELKVFDVKLNDALRDNKARGLAGGRFVPEDVIRKQHSRLQGTKSHTLEKPLDLIPYSGTPGKPKAILVDIDGTLAHMRDYRSPYDWHKVGLDDLDEFVSTLVKFIVEGSEGLARTELDLWKIIIMSGRDEAARYETELWLDKHGIYYDELFMRPEKDQRRDNIVKHELFNTYVRDNYDVQGVLDDRDQVVEMWRGMGLKCVQVEPGAF